MSNGHQYTIQQLAWLKVREHLPRRQLADMFNLHWGASVSASAIKGVCQRRGMKTGRTGRFTKGGPRVPGSGAKSRNATSFKKGQLPHNHNPIGHVRYCKKDGYMSVKITDTRVSRKDYVAVHRLVWEHYHGSIPPNHIISFINGDIYDFRIENLELVSRALHAVRCKLNYYSYPVELRPELGSIVELTRSLARRTRKVSNDHHTTKPPAK